MPESRSRRFIVCLAPLLAVLFLCPYVAHAESLEVMASRADTIVISVVKNKVSYWDGKIIRTRATLEITRVVAGAMQKKEISVVYDGGIVGKIGLKVSHGVRLPVGQKTLLFLQRSGEHFSVLDEAGGIFFILPGKTGELAVAARNIPDTPGVSIRSALTPAAAERGIPLNDFLTTIKEFIH